MTSARFAVPYLIIAIVFMVFRYAYLSAKHRGERASNGSAAIVSGMIWPLCLCIEILATVALFGKVIGKHAHDRKAK